MTTCQEFKQKRAELEQFHQEFGELFRDLSPEGKGVLTFPKEQLQELTEKGKALKKQLKEISKEFKILHYYWQEFLENKNAKLKVVLDLNENTVTGGEWHTDWILSHSFTDDSNPLGKGLLVTAGADKRVLFIDLSDPQKPKIKTAISAENITGGEWHTDLILSHSFTDVNHPLGEGPLVTAGDDGKVKFTRPEIWWDEEDEY